LGVGLTTLPCKKEIVEKPPRNSAIFNGRRLRRRPRPKLGCRAKEREREMCCTNHVYKWMLAMSLNS
jgi:hypothetical protein